MRNGNTSGGGCLKSQTFLGENRESASGLYGGAEYFSLARTFKTACGNENFRQMNIMESLTEKIIRNTKIRQTMLKILTFQFNPFSENCSLAYDETGDAVIIDPGFYNEKEASALYSKIAEKGLKPKMILLTHGHFDHIFGVKECADKYGIPVYMNQEDNYVIQHNFSSRFGLKEPDSSFTTEPLEDEQIIRFGNTEFKVITTPGHTSGGVCFYDEKDKALFSGDTLFAGAIGRTDHPTGDYDKLIVSVMDKLMGLPGDVTVFPGHGPNTTISDERTHNPFLQPFNEPDSDMIDWDADGIELDGTI